MIAHFRSVFHPAERGVSCRLSCCLVPSLCWGPRDCLTGIPCLRVAAAFWGLALAGQRPSPAAWSPSVPGDFWTVGTPLGGRSRHARAGCHCQSCCSGSTRGPEGRGAPPPGAFGGTPRPPALCGRKEGELLESGTPSLSCCLFWDTNSVLQNTGSPAGPTNPLNTLRRVHNTFRGPWTSFNFFKNLKKNSEDIQPDLYQSVIKYNV